jgi:hypothetical protein
VLPRRRTGLQAAVRGRPYEEGRIAGFKNIDLYPLLCHLLHIDPAPVDGDLERIRQILK